MHTLVLAQIDALHRHRDPAQRAFRHRFRRPRKCDDGSVVIRVPFRAQHQHARRRSDRIFNRAHRRCIPPFGKIGDAFTDQRAGHFTSGLSTRTAPRIITRFTRFTPR